MVKEGIAMSWSFSGSAAAGLVIRQVPNTGRGPNDVRLPMARVRNGAVIAGRARICKQSAAVGAVIR
ncbi:hypothetical protein STHU_26780 [Allostella humosa]|nr:hypothetical protein STHU_26780 [Stella humosa]